VGRGTDLSLREQKLDSHARHVDISGEQLKVILRHVAPIEQYATWIAEAHGLGFGPGEHTDVWSAELQCKAQKIWKETLPPLFLRQVADSYGRCAWLMESVLPNESIAGEWASICGYLIAVAAAIHEDPDCAVQEVPLDSPDIGYPNIGYMPTLIHYDRLAGLMSVDAVERLRSSAAAVARHCRSSSPTAPNEVQLACLQGLANGERHIGLANRLGYSGRHLQRILADLWRQFGVDNATQGVALAVAQGWVTVPVNAAPTIRRERRSVIGAQLAGTPLNADEEAVLNASASDVADASGWRLGEFLPDG